MKKIASTDRQKASSLERMVRRCGIWFETIELRLAGWRRMPSHEKPGERVWLGGMEPYPCEHTCALMLLRSERWLNNEAETRKGR
jgi:hypothetical protein